MQLIYFPLDPRSRSARLLLNLKKAPYTTIIAFKDIHNLQQNPKGILPVLESKEHKYFGIWSILLTIETTYITPPYLENSAVKNAPIFQMMEWILWDFYQDIYLPLLEEKILKPLKKLPPNATVLNQCFKNLEKYLRILNDALQKQSHIVADVETLADVVAIASLSSIEYINSINFSPIPEVYEWYIRWKSRPAFQPFLTDRIPSIPPSPTYAQLDY